MSSWLFSTTDSGLPLIAAGPHLGKQPCQGPEPPFPAGRYLYCARYRDFTPGAAAVRGGGKGRGAPPALYDQEGFRPFHSQHVSRPNNVG